MLSPSLRCDVLRELRGCVLASDRILGVLGFVAGRDFSLEQTALPRIELGLRALRRTEERQHDDGEDEEAEEAVDDNDDVEEEIARCKQINLFVEGQVALGVTLCLREEVTTADFSVEAETPDLHKHEPDERQHKVYAVHHDCDVVQNWRFKPNSDLVRHNSQKVENRQVKAETDRDTEAPCHISANRCHLPRFFERCLVGVGRVARAMDGRVVIGKKTESHQQAQLDQDHDHIDQHGALPDNLAWLGLLRFV